MAARLGKGGISQCAGSRVGRALPERQSISPGSAAHAGVLVTKEGLRESLYPRFLSRAVCSPRLVADLKKAETHAMEQLSPREPTQELQLLKPMSLEPVPHSREAPQRYTKKFIVFFR